MLWNDDRPLAAQIGEKNFKRLFLDPPPEDGRAYYALTDRDFSGFSSDRCVLRICYDEEEKQGVPPRDYPFEMP